MPPKKTLGKTLSRANKSDDEKKRTNLKDLLSRSSSTVERGAQQQQKRQAEKDGDFVFKRSSSQAASSANNSSGLDLVQNRPKSKGQAEGQPPLKKIRKLRAEDMAITPDAKLRRSPKKSQKMATDDDYTERSTTTHLALPISDTPIIRRNKEMRNGNTVRRSSMEKRGKRVSSIGNGFTGMPHDQVPTSDFYKHLDATMPDPHKMRQLLTWCARRVFEDEKTQHVKQKNNLPSKELTALNIAKVIKEEIVRELVDGKINISWWNRLNEKDEDDLLSRGKKKLLPNERNQKNSQLLKDLKQRLQELKSTSAQWGHSMSKLIELPTISVEKAHATTAISSDGEQFQKVIDKSLIEEISALEESTFKDISQNLEFTLDSFNDLIHQLKSSSSLRKKFISLKSHKLSEVLDSTIDDDALNKIQNNEHNKNLNTDQLLTGIAKLDR